MDYFKENFGLHIYWRGEAPSQSRGTAPPESEGVLAFGCQKEVAKLSPFSVLC